MKLLLLILLSAFATSLHLSAQIECSPESINVCYLPESKYCSGNNAICPYTMGGSFMSAYIPPKLSNPDYFGPDGIVDCSINLLALEDDLTIQYLEDQECNIIFTGNFLLNGDVLNTSLSEAVLNTIYTWSTMSVANLVITSQAEAKTWGYIINDLNVNPNTSSGDLLGEKIFDGDFGTVNTFNQGGTFQGIIDEGPSTGFRILGQDANNNPTLVIDNYTNDIILGDIGIFCGGGAGDLSAGPLISNDNDILLANIFALSCQLTFTEFEEQEIDICEGDSHQLNSGIEIFDSGTFIDTIKNSNGCDSLIITTQINVNEHTESEITYSGLIGDGYSIRIGDEVFDEGNPEGVALIKNVLGCDSTVIVRFEYFETDIYIPNTFNPNDPNFSNSVFSIYAEENYFINQMQIYDRWGNVIFESKNFPMNDETFGWDGRFNGVEVNPGVYVYLIEIGFSENFSIIKNGTVTLLR